jgi:polyisoprenoid-binding protein YceI
MCQKIFASNDSSVAVEAFERGLFRKRRLILFFESFSGAFFHSLDSPQSSRLELQVDAASIVCRERSLSSGKRRRITQCAREVVLAAGQYPQIVFRSTSLTEKPLRGFVMQGDLTIRGITRTTKANLGLSEMSNDRLQLDADATIRLDDFGIKPPSSLFGLTNLSQEAMVHVLLWTNTPGL